MRQDKRIWNLFCFITAFSVFFAVMGEARLHHSFVLAKPMSGKRPHILTEVKRQPDLALFWTLSQRVSQPHSGLSDTQKARIQAEFRRLFFQVIAAEQEVLNDVSGTSFSMPWTFGKILAEHRQAIHNIFTSEQNRTHRSRQTTSRMSVELQAASEPAQRVLTKIKCAQIHSSCEEEISDATAQFSRVSFAQMNPPSFFGRDLHQLQILRL